MAAKLSDHFESKKLLLFVLPSVCMMVFTSIYVVVDGFFVSNYAGKTAFAAVNLIIPFTMILGAVGFMIGTGSTALVSKVMGEGDDKRANRIFSMMVYLTISFGVFFTAIGVALVPRVAVLLGATDEMLPDCVLYGRIIICFTTMFMLQNVFQSLFVAAEKPKLGLLATVGAGVTNMVLDFLFVGVLGRGVAGAALATGISQLVGGVLPLIYFALPNKSRLRLCPARLEIKPILKVCANGSSELMTNVSLSLVSMIYNAQLMKYIGENGVSAYGVLMYAQMIFISIYIGYAVGSAPIISYNYGAKNHAELKSMLKKSLAIISVTGVFLTALAFFLSGTVAKIFVGYDAELYELTVRAFKIFSCSFLLAGFNIFASAFFTALNNGAVSALISFLRTLLFQSICVLVLPIVFGINGIWWAMTVAEIFALIVSAGFIIGKRKKYHYM